MALSCLEIGQQRLKELRLQGDVGFSAIELGWYSMQRKPVLVVLTGLTGNRKWQLMPFTRENTARHRGHCYLVKGRKVAAMEYIHKTGSVREILSAYEGADLSKPVYSAGAEAIFHDGKGQRTRKKPQVSRGGGNSQYIATKRFKNSHITCACKCKKY